MQRYFTLFFHGKWPTMVIMFKGWTAIHWKNQFTCWAYNSVGFICSLWSEIYLLLSARFTWSVSSICLVSSPYNCSNRSNLVRWVRLLGDFQRLFQCQIFLLVHSGREFVHQPLLFKLQFNDPSINAGGSYRSVVKRDNWWINDKENRTHLKTINTELCEV